MSAGFISDAADTDNTGCFWIGQTWGVVVSNTGADYAVAAVEVNKGKALADTCGNLDATILNADV